MQFFDVLLFGPLGNQVFSFRIWDTGRHWLLLNFLKEYGYPCYSETETTYVPQNLVVYRNAGVIHVLWDGLEQWQCSTADEIATMAIQFGDYNSGLTPIRIDSIYADANLFSVASVQIENDNEHVTLDQPLIAWSTQAQPGWEGQDGFEIAIGTDSNWAIAEVWDPEVVTSSDTAVLYNGLPLVDGLRYFVHLRVRHSALWSDWYQSSFRMNSLPSIPVQVGPINNQVAGSTPTLWVHNATDAEGDVLSYDFAGFHDTDCVSGPAIELNSVPSGADSTGGQITTVLAENCRYWWMVRAFDGYEYSEWSPWANFFVDGSPEPPGAFALSSPPDSVGLPVFTMLPTMHWQQSFDPDPYDTVRYKLEVSPRQNFAFAYVRDSILTTEFTLTDSLDFATHYWWRVTARDRTGLSIMSAVSDFWTWTLGDINHDHTCDIGDLSRLVDFLFFGADISPRLVGDISGDCALDISDLSRMIDYLFFGGTAPEVGC